MSQSSSVICSVKVKLEREGERARVDGAACENDTQNAPINLI